MMITPPFWGVVLGFAVVVVALGYGAWRAERTRAAHEALQREVLAGLRRQPVPDDAIDTDWA